MEERQGGCGDDDDEAKPKPVLSFIEALHVLESMRAFLYAHSITGRYKRTLWTF
jgi:hypothetical protein